MTNAKEVKLPEHSAYFQPIYYKDNLVAVLTTVVQGNSWTTGSNYSSSALFSCWLIQYQRKDNAEDTLLLFCCSFSPKQAFLHWRYCCQEVVSIPWHCKKPARSFFHWRGEEINKRLTITPCPTTFSLNFSPHQNTLTQIHLVFLKTFPKV